jgi:hypothetical protein
VSYTETDIEYAFSFVVGSDSAAQGFSAEFSSANMNDGLAFKLIDAWLALPWLSGANPAVNMTKRDSSATTYTANLTTRTFS